MDGHDENAYQGPKHYSGRNRVPNIQEFMRQLDSDKAERDAGIDAEQKQTKTKDKGKAKGEPKEHKDAQPPKSKNTKKVRDPVTGADVEIQDVDLDFKEAADNPHVCSPLD